MHNFHNNCINNINDHCNMNKTYNMYNHNCTNDTINKRIHNNNYINNNNDINIINNNMHNNNDSNTNINDT